LLFSLGFSSVYAQEFRQIQRVEDQPYIAVIAITNGQTSHYDEVFTFTEGDIEVNIHYLTTDNYPAPPVPPDYDSSDILTVESVSENYLVIPSEMNLEEGEIGFFYVYYNNLM
jgi:hypothetical protein